MLYRKFTASVLVATAVAATSLLVSVGEADAATCSNYTRSVSGGVEYMYNNCAPKPFRLNVMIGNTSAGWRHDRYVCVADHGTAKLGFVANGSTGPGGAYGFSARTDGNC
ncbi:hypothetical protein NLX83_13355 [Allokutzneria sp. A3M-2-11 16]|uniref:hypothetical protein n=1 Tax=Allokutzneria sp. A3M-2-11 16 TaxID=2962043 RepID=UPI0020B6CD0E|nr:hypothetical protein [Allokutzneria sp. A3M-2-11 16]MCP3800246.1 hypothetical protein [Allokutzneria sp. A3M-2-11 16]